MYLWAVDNQIIKEKGLLSSWKEKGFSNNFEIKFQSQHSGIKVIEKTDIWAIKGSWNFWIISRIRGKNHSNSKSSFGNSYSNVMFDPWVVSESHLRWKTWLTARNSTFYVFLEVFSPPSISPFPWMCFFWGRILYLATVMSSRPVWILYGVRRALILLKMEIDWWIFLL